MNANNIITPQQKLIAGAGGIGALVLLYFLLPPLVLIASNMLVLGLYAAPLLAVAFFHRQIWNKLQIVSFNWTKNMISDNPTFFLERGYDYIISQVKEMRTHLIASNSIIKETENQVTQYINDIEAAERSHAKATDESIKKIIAAKIGTLQQAVDTILPSIDVAKQQRDEMSNVLNNFSADSEILRCKIDNLNTQHDLLKQLSSLSDKGRKLLNNNTPQAKEFKESIKQTERKVFEFTANIEGFQKEIFTYSQLKELESEENQQKGLEVIQQYKAKRLTV